MNRWCFWCVCVFSSSCSYECFHFFIPMSFTAKLPYGRVARRPRCLGWDHLNGPPRISILHPTCGDPLSLHKVPFLSSGGSGPVSRCLGGRYRAASWRAVRTCCAHWRGRSRDGARERGPSRAPRRWSNTAERAVPNLGNPLGRHWGPNVIHSHAWHSSTMQHLN